MLKFFLFKKLLRITACVKSCLPIGWRNFLFMKVPAKVLRLPQCKAFGRGKIKCVVPLRIFYTIGNTDLGWSYTSRRPLR
jgi:hypothetical protein